jgi:FMN phosphatase YigB (HAD superfamily)
MKIFLDFDRTLYDLDALHEAFSVRLRKEGISQEVYDASRKYFSHGSGKQGEIYTPEIHERIIRELASSVSDNTLSEIMRGIASDAQHLVFDEVRGILGELEGYERIILTFGNEEYQKFKITGSGLDNLMDDIIVTTGEKWEEMEKAMKTGEVAVFVDDHRSYFLQPRGNQPVHGIHLVRKSDERNFCNGCRASYHASDLREASEIIKNLA